MAKTNHNQAILAVSYPDTGDAGCDFFAPSKISVFRSLIYLLESRSLECVQTQLIRLNCSKLALDGVQFSLGNAFSTHSTDNVQRNF